MEHSIFEIFQETADAHADQLAVHDLHGGTLDYAALRDRARRVSAGLVARGMMREVPTGLWLSQGTGFVTALLGVLGAGGIYAPLDPRNPGARNAEILSGLGASAFVITRAADMEQVRALTSGIVVTLEDLLADEATVETRPARADDAAYVLHTSGTTGRPKGVVQTHRGVLHNAMTHINSFRLGPADRVSLLYPPGVYGGNRDIFNALLSGASLHRYPVETLGLGPLAEWLVTRRITVLCCVATVFRQFARALEKEVFPALRLIKIGGEAVFRADLELFQRHFGGHCLVSCGLGATETGAATQVFFDRATLLPDTRVPCGFPVEDFEILLVDDQRLPVAAGDAGEIAVRSRYLSPGYWRRPDWTERAFRDEPDGRRTYFTGDLGRWRADGQLLHLGRRDLQVKIHGNRVELLDVEAHLLEAEFILEAAVMPEADAQGGNRLAACIVTAGGMMDETEALRRIRAHLLPRLPAFMIPARVLVLEKMPLLGHGKPDRARLTERLAAPDVKKGVETYMAAGSELESTIVSLWCEATRRDTMRADDDFFLSGGDSVALMQFLLLLEKRLGRRITPEQLVRAATPARLAALLSSSRSERCAGSVKLTPDDVFPGLAIIPLRAEGGGPPIFLAAPAGGSVVPFFALAARLGPGRPVYGLQVYVPWSQRRLRMDIAALGRAFAACISRQHPEGPCVVGGWSFGGFLALSIAAELEKLGRQVQRVLVIDSDMALPGRRTTLRTLLADTAMFYRVLWHARSHFFNHAHLVIQASLKRGTSRGGRRLNALDHLVARLLWRAGAGDAEIARHIRHEEHDLLARCGELQCLFTLRVFIRAIQRYAPPVVQADVEVLQPASSSPERAALWQRATTGRVRAHAVPGNHVSLLDSAHVSVLAEVCSHALAGDHGPVNMLSGQPCQPANTA